MLRVCVQVLAGVKERVEASDKTIASWAEEKPWIKEEDTKDVTEKVSSVLRALLRHVTHEPSLSPYHACGCLVAGDGDGAGGL